ncbi:DUF6531 domain-containing protein, partial [Actinomadura soli]|uniref:DUF6531 domain-containing protein n=1 Tax=Actinomadura soli TaxID=2508997 RepID=UPI00197ACE92
RQQRGGGRDRGQENPRHGGRQPGGRSTTHDPIDVITGEVLLTETDVTLPGILPLVLERTHVSSYRDGRLFGTSWASTLDQRLEIDATGVHFLSADAMALKYPHAGVPNVQFRPVEGPQWPLVLTPDGGYRLTDPQLGRTLHFPSPGEEYGWSDVPVTAITDRSGDRIDFRYENGTLVEIRHSGGHRVAVDTAENDPQRMDAGRRLMALRLLTDTTADGTDGGITLIRYRYDGDGELAEVINSSGSPLRYAYDDKARLTSWTDRNGFSYGYDYDTEGRAVRGTGSGGLLSTTLAFDPENRTTLVIDSLGHTTTYRYNDHLQVIAQTDPLGATTRSEWDRYDRLLARTDPLGHTTRYSYDEVGNLTGILRPDGARAEFVYNDLNLPVRITDAGGHIWHHAYDDRGNLTRITDPAGAAVTYTHDTSGRLTAITNPQGQTTTMDVDALGSPIAVTDPRGAVTRFAHDVFGRIASVTDPVGGTTRFGWTVEGRPAWRQLPDGTHEKWSYDAEGNLLEYTDPAGHTTRAEYTGFKTPIAETGPDGARLEFGYDTENRLTQVTDAKGATWTYEYDAAGNLLTETDFNGRTVTYSHDMAGRLISKVNATGQTIAFTRDEMGTVVEKRVGDAVSTYEHDPLGRLTGAANAAARLSFERDPVGRIVAERCNGAALISEYNLLGQRTRRLTPSGAESTWTYDPAGMPATLTTGGQVIGFGYDAAGREVQRRIGSGTILAQQWDATHQLSTQTLWGAPTPESAGKARLLQHRTYTYRPDGIPTAITDRLTGDRRFELDTTGRVTSVSGHGWAERYVYDRSGQVTDASWPTSAAANAAASDAVGDREYSGTLVRRAGNVRYEYDAQGRMVLRQHARLSSKPLTWRFHWDAEDHLIGVETPEGHHWRYTYDALGRRIAKQRLTADGRQSVEQTHFMWDFDVLAEQVHTLWSPERQAWTRECTTWEYEPGSFRPVTQVRRVPLAEAPQNWMDQRFDAIVTDLVGAPAELVGADGAVAGRAPTTLWGARDAHPPAHADCPLAFPGQYRDAETLLNYNHHRYYDPLTARYGSADPIGLAGGFDPHSYVPNPLSWVDPLGLRPKGPPEVFERYGSKAEAEASRDANGLVPRPGHERQPKWIGDQGTVDPRTLGKRQNYTHYMEIHADPGTRQWLKDQGYETKPTNEPGRYEIPEEAREAFNERVRKIDIRPRSR